MKKPLSPIVLSPLIKLILLLFSLQLSLISYAHADGIHFNSVKYIKDYGFLGVGDNGLAVYSADGLNWRKITLPSIGTNMNLINIIIAQNDGIEKGFTILTIDSHGNYKDYQFETDKATIKFIKQKPLNYPNFVILDELKVIDGGNTLTILVGYNKNDKKLEVKEENLSSGETKTHTPNPPLIIKHVSSKFISEYEGGALLALESPLNGAHLVLAHWNRKILSNHTVQILPIKYQPATIDEPTKRVYDGFAGESYVIDVTPESDGTINAYKLTPAGQPVLHRVVHTRRALSESGVVAIAAAADDSKDGGLVFAATDATGDGVEVVADLDNTMRTTHLSIAARTCAYREDSKTLVNGKPTGNITIFLGKDNYALVSTDGKHSWRRMPIIGL